MRAAVDNIRNRQCTTTWEAGADERGHWRLVVQTGMRRGEDIDLHMKLNRGRRGSKSSHPPQPTTNIYLQEIFGRDARVGLISHSRKDLIFCLFNPS